MFSFLRTILGIPIAHAQGVGSGPGVGEMWNRICNTLPFCDLGLNAPQHFTQRVLNLVFPLITGVAVCVLIYAGIKLMLAQGEDTTETKRMVTMALVGVVLSLFATVIMRFVTFVLFPAILGG